MTGEEGEIIPAQYPYLHATDGHVGRISAGEVNPFEAYICDTRIIENQSGQLLFETSKYSSDLPICSRISVPIFKACITFQLGENIPYENIPTFEGEVISSVKFDKLRYYKNYIVLDVYQRAFFFGY